MKTLAAEARNSVVKEEKKDKVNLKSSGRSSGRS